MYTEQEIQAMVDECKYMWTDKKDEYAVLKADHGFLIYHMPTREVGGIEIHTVHQRLIDNMLAAGAKIIDEYPDEDIE